MKPQRTRGMGGERGFVLVWTAIVVLPVLTMGMIFLLYSQACVTKLRAQLNAMNLVAIGTFGAEFDSNETLNAMAMLARWQGFPNAQPVVTGQDFPGVGTLIFNHDTSQTGEHKVAAFQRLERGKFSALLNNVTKIDTSGFSRAQPTKSYAAIVLDYSRSLNDDRSIGDLLRAYDVLNGSGGLGVNGELINPTGPNRPSNVRPKPHVQSALPYGFDPGTRRWFSWDGLNMVWPDWETTAEAGCTPGPENGCSGSTPTHRGAIAYNLTDLFMSYKRASAILVGVTALLTRRMDVGIVGSPFPPEIFDLLAPYTQAADPDDQPGYFDRVENDGFFWAWRYDEADITNIQLNSGGSPLLQADIVKQYSYDDPKSPFQHSVKISPDRVVVSNLQQAGWRKLVQYGTFFDTAGVPYTFPKAKNYLSPPLLELNRPPPNYPPTDAFVWSPGAYDLNTGTVPEGGIGYPLGIVPFLATRGSVHPTDGDLPPELKDIREYTPETGSPVTINSLLSKDKWSPGYGACKLYDYVDDGSFPPNNSANCDGTKDLPDNDKTASVYTEGLALSPDCEAGYTPRCAGRQNPSLPHDVADDENAPLCLYGFARCYPEFGLNAVCFMPNGKGNSNQGTFQRVGTALVNPRCSSKDTYPAGHLGEPKKRGTLALPSNPREISNHSLFYLLFDAVNTIGGTFLQSGVRAGLNRCKAARQLAEERGEQIDCLINIATDGRPIPNDWFGQPWTGGGTGPGLSETVMLDQLEADVIELTGPSVNGRIFTWFLGKKGAYDAILEQYNQLTLGQQALLSFVPAKQSIPGNVTGSNLSTACQDFLLYIGNALGVTCAAYNTTILTEQGYFERFKSIMGGGGSDPKKVWVETQIPTTTAGQAQVTAEFGLDIAELLALNKRQVEFNQ